MLSYVILYVIISCYTCAREESDRAMRAGQPGPGPMTFMPCMEGTGSCVAAAQQFVPPPRPGGRGAAPPFSARRTLPLPVSAQVPLWLASPPEARRTIGHAATSRVSPVLCAGTGQRPASSSAATRAGSPVAGTGRAVAGPSMGLTRATSPVPATCAGGHVAATEGLGGARSASSPVLAPRALSPAAAMATRGARHVPGALPTFNVVGLRAMSPFRVSSRNASPRPTSPWRGLSPEPHPAEPSAPLANITVCYITYYMMYIISNYSILHY